ncbi:MAG: phenylacetate--CoA ligase [Syntrophobacteraceae bacterium]|nr:phenylacetate--CoA ligase [Syntrophobacteraceae bacterium]
MPVWNAREECLDLDERAQQQLERLQSTLNRAYKNVPFYRNRFDQQGIDLSQAETLGDLARMPFTGREHFSENYPYGLFAVPLRDVVRIHTAQGTALRPTVSGYTKQDLQVWRELVARGLSAAGVSSADILQIDLDPGLANWGRDYKDGAETVGASVIPLSALPPEKQLMVMRDYRTSVLVTTPSAAEQLADLIFRSRLNPNELSLKTLILVGEATKGGVQAQLEEQLHVKTWAQYGLSEVPGPALAFECEERKGLHVGEDHFYVEVIDPATGAVLPDGEEGELVLTTLTTKAFPLIRFRTGDRVRLIPQGCPCGRTLRRMEWFAQRTDEMMTIRGVKIHHHQILLFLELALGFIPQSYRFLIKRRDLRDVLEIWVKVDEEIFSDEVKEMERLSQNLCAELTQELGIPVQIRLKEGGSFEPPLQFNRLEDLR